MPENTFAAHWVVYVGCHWPFAVEERPVFVLPKWDSNQLQANMHGKFTKLFILY